jgi:hypothetical protein
MHYTVILQHVQGKGRLDIQHISAGISLEAVDIAVTKLRARYPTTYIEDVIVFPGFLDRYADHEDLEGVNESSWVPSSLAEE